jgi:type III pantothenate kinase
LVEAFSRLAATRPSLHVNLVGAEGDVAYSRRVRALIGQQEKGIANRIRLHGRVGQSDLCRMLSNADIFAMPSLQEGFGIALLEAMHYGLPIVATRISAIPELVSDKINGLLVPPADPAALAEALGKLADSSSLRHELGRAGQERVKSRFDWEITCRQFEQEMSAVM